MRGRKSGRILLIGKSHKKRNIGLRHANRFGCRHKIVKHTSPTTTPKCPHCSSVSQSLFISLYRRCEDWLASFLPCSVKDSDSWYQVVLRGMSFLSGSAIRIISLYIISLIIFICLFLPLHPHTQLPPSAIILMGRRGINIFRCLYWWTLLAPPPVHP